MSRGYYHLVWICPFYKKNEKEYIVCEAGKVDFKDKAQAYQFFGKYCASFKYEDCSLAQSLMGYLERIENEQENNKKTKTESDRKTEPDKAQLQKTVGREPRSD